jgi:hypothetical protein
MKPEERKFPIYDLLVALVHDQHIHNGHWGLSVQFEANGAAIPANGKTIDRLPGLAIGVSGVTLIRRSRAKPGRWTLRWSTH